MISFQRTLVSVRDGCVGTDLHPLGLFYARRCPWDGAGIDARTILKGVG